MIEDKFSSDEMRYDDQQETRGEKNDGDRDRKRYKDPTKVLINQQIETINKLLGQLKFALIVVFLTVLFFYFVVSKDNTKADYQIRLLNDILIKLESTDKPKNPVLDAINGKNTIQKIVDLSASTKQCAACHNEQNIIKLFPSWTYEDFKFYMRGTKRIPTNNIMPNYNSTQLSDKEIEQIYLILLQNK